MRFLHKGICAERVGSYDVVAALRKRTAEFVTHPGAGSRRNGGDLPVIIACSLETKIDAGGKRVAALRTRQKPLSGSRKDVAHVVSLLTIAGSRKQRLTLPSHLTRYAPEVFPAAGVTAEPALAEDHLDPAAWLEDSF
ncbi:hypothetical protein [Rhizobium bangladeshense]|uniref:hypothetical protein n=1 Tax=Rhizobium bangladeshense TaxID=1138189 RepID=UPI001C832481|nr:hypothetical protein [Rhizobium bangladeshense]MBX4893545.1 hypothetical protein [Rhizobium bangladeshense]